MSGLTSDVCDIVVCKYDARVLSWTPTERGQVRREGRYGERAGTERGQVRREGSYGERAGTERASTKRGHVRELDWDGDLDWDRDLDGDVDLDGDGDLDFGCLD